MAKPFLTYDQQLEKLRNEKNLLIDDTEVAKESLKNIGYFSLVGGYKTPFINSMTRIYQNGASFNDILALYQFDLSLRELVFTPTTRNTSPKITQPQIGSCSEMK